MSATDSEKMRSGFELGASRCAECKIYECNGQREAVKRLRAGRGAVRGMYGYTSATDSEKL
ncbi:MAG TPA: hypothetical protein H9780_07145 [Candidatus Mediterraneibacter merdavium]|nr:hypothetical protein [Candidatus Mediterraneibacter merdavium]